MGRVDRSRFHRRRNYLLALASEAGAVPLRAGARLYARRPQDPESWRRGLIVAHSHIGDVLYRTPSLPALARALPGCSWTFLTSEAGAEVLRGNPHAAPFPAITGESSWQLAPGGFRSLQRSRFDVALCTNTLGYGQDLLLAIALGIGSRVSTTHKGLSGLVTHAVEIPYPAPFPAYFRAMVAELADSAPSWPLRPLIYSDEADAGAARKEFEALGLGSRPVLACAPCSRQRGGAWPLPVFAEILRELRGDHDVVLLGGREDRPALEETAARAGVRPRVLAGSLNLRPLAAFLARCAALLAQDSGPRHLGNAAGIPVGFLRNLCVDPVETGAYLDTELDLAPSLPRLGTSSAVAVIREVSPSRLAARLADFMVTSAAEAERS